MDMVTDLHSHILPGIDDGSSCVEESLKMLRMEAAQGIRHVVATPHFYPRYDDPGHFLSARTEAEKRLREAMAKEAGLPEISVGAEVYFFPGISDSEILPRLTIEGKGCILIEMPHAPWGKGIYRELEQIWLRWGITPVVAHIDRYIAPFRSYGIPEQLAELPVLVQANADFFLQRRTCPMAMRMLKKGQIHLLGSDCHNMTSRCPNLGEAVEKIRQRLGQEAIEGICSTERELLLV